MVTKMYLFLKKTVFTSCSLHNETFCLTNIFLSNFMFFWLCIIAHQYSEMFCWPCIIAHQYNKIKAVSQMVDTLCYQVGRSEVRFPMVSLEFFSDISFQTRYGPGIDSASNRNEYQPVHRADNLTTFMCQLSWNLEASTSWNPLGLSRPVIRLLYHFTFPVMKYIMMWFQYLVFQLSYVTMSQIKQLW
jgi:hypothetical protein